MPPPRDAGRPLFTAVGVLIVFWFVLFAPQLFSHRAFLAGDAALFRRFSEFSRQRWLASHVRTFWNPYVFLGLPSTSSLADMRPQYLPDALLNGWEALRRLPAIPPLALPLVAHLFGMLAVALLARELWRCGATGMVWAGMAWALAPGLLVPLTFGHDAQFIAASLLPVLLLCVQVLFGADDDFRAAWAALALAATFGLQCLGGHPQVVVASAVSVSAFAAERAARFRHPRRLALALAAMTLGLAIGAAVWWPALLYGRDSVRGGTTGVSAAEVENFSHAWRDLLTMFWPRALGFGGATYWGGLRKTDYPAAVGTLVCALALLAWPRAGRHERGAFTLLWIAIVTAVLLSLGTHLAGLDRVLRSVPLFGRFRVAVTWLVIAQPAFALLSALGVERLFARSRVRSRLDAVEVLFALAALLSVAAGTALLVSPFGGGLAAFARTLRPSLTIDAAHHAVTGAGVDLIWRALLPSALLLLCRSRRAAPLHHAAVVCTFALLALDLGAVDVPFLVSTSGLAARLAAAPPPALARAAAADPLARALPLDVALVNTNDWITWRARSAAGVHGAVDRDWNTLMGAGLATHYEALCAFAIRYVTLARDATAQPGLWTRVADGGDAGVVRLTRALPRAYCVARVSAPGDRAEVIDALLADSFRAHDVALADEAQVAGAYPGSRDCTLAWIEDSPDHLCMATQARDASFLVVADPLLPGWSARLDGQRWPMHRVNYMVRGVQLPAGHHVVEMTYVPPGWREAVPVTRGALAAIPLAAFALGLAGWVARPRRAWPGPPELQRTAA